jgi:hypothetical protein
MRESSTSEVLKFARSRCWRWGVRRATALLIAAAVLNLYVTASSAAPNLKLKSVIGTVTATGVVQVNESPVIPGQTLFSGSSIRTFREAESMLELGNQARFKLEAETSLMLESSKLGLSASLNNGTVRVFVPGGIRSAITTSDASITTDSNEATVFNVMTDSCNTTVSVQTGRLEVRAGNKLRFVSSGERLSTGAPGPPEPPQNLSGRKKAGLFLGIGGAIAILLIALTGKEKVTEMPGGGGCVIILSPGGGVGGC